VVEGGGARRNSAVVVNDDPTQLQLLAAMLRRLHLDVTTFLGAEAALTAMVNGPPPSVIVTDLHMPGIDGWRFCRLLRSAEYAAFNAVPIVVVSATFSGEEASRITTGLGANAFLSAPVDGGDFAATVLAMLAGSTVGPRPRVLVVEDSPTLAALLVPAFTRSGYQADVVKTIAAADEALERTAYDIAVLDYHLPDGTSDHLLTRIRKDRPDCVCIVMTTDAEPGLAVALMRHGAAAYLHKPFEMDYLIELCSRACRERALLRVEELLERRTLQLRTREAHYRLLLDNMTDLIAQFTPDGRILFVSPAYCATFGTSEDELVGTSFVPLIHEDDQATRAASLERVLVPPHTTRHEERALTVDGWRWFSWSARAVLDGAGGVASVISVGRDITDQRLAEQKYQILFDEMLDGFSLHDIICDDAGRPVDYRFITVNPAFERLTGLRADDILGRRVLEVLPGVEPHWIETFGKVALTGEPVTFENVVADLDKHFEVTAFRPAPGQFACIFADITERKRAEAERERLQAQLAQSQKMESVGRLAGGVAHDFNNMLSVILGHTELAIDSVAPGQPIHQDLTEILTATRRSAELTRQLLTFARKQTVNPRPLVLNDVVEGMLKMLQRLIGEDIDLVWHPADEAWLVEVDPGQVDQMLVNLCVNARDAIDEGGRIAIRAGTTTLSDADCSGRDDFRPGEYVTLVVEDDGCGMSREILARACEPFFTTKPVGKGTGLGLASVYGAAQQNGGFVTIDSVPTQGTTVTIFLPRHGGEAVPYGSDGAGKPDRPANHETILLVEDEPAILTLNTTALRRLGYRVIAASSPKQALQVADEHDGDIDLVITDVIMPEMNGRDLVETLQARRPRLKRLYMSGYTDDIIAQHGVLDPGVPFLQKPYSMRDFASNVRSVLDDD